MPRNPRGVSSNTLHGDSTNVWLSQGCPEQTYWDVAVVLCEPFRCVYISLHQTDHSNNGALCTKTLQCC